MILVGDLIDGRYRVEAHIGSGAMGEVFRVLDLKLECLRAVKLLKDRAENERQRVERFKREAQASARIAAHENVVAIHDYVAGHRDEKYNRYINHYIVMDLTEGQSLEQVLEGNRRLPLTRAMALIEDICNGVGAAHRKNIVHRDLSPKNVIVCQTESGEAAKVIDFGVAKLPDASSGAERTKLTHESDTMGTPAYMAPEQWDDPSEVGPEADVYSLGCIAYELMAGRRPFEAETIRGWRNKHSTGTPPAFKGELRIPHQVENVIRRALKKRAADRQADANTLYKELSHALTKVENENTRAAQEQRQREEVEKRRGLNRELEALKIENQDLREVEELLLAKLKSAEEERHLRAQEAKTLQMQIAQVTKKGEEESIESRKLRADVVTLTSEVETQKQAVEAAKQDVAKLLKERDSSRQEAKSLRAEVGRMKSDADEERKQRQAETQTLQTEKRSLEQQIQKLRRSDVQTQIGQSSRGGNLSRAFATIAVLAVGAIAGYFGRDALTNIGKFTSQPPSANANNITNHSDTNIQGTAKEHSDTRPNTNTAQPSPPEGMVYVPGGIFKMGRNRSDGGDEYESPAHQARVDPFFIDQYEVTNADYAKFINTNNRPPPKTWSGGIYPPNAGHKPVTGVTWDDANAYAHSVGKRVPTEKEWEFAARGTAGFRYPWGNVWEQICSESDDSEASGPANVGSCPKNKSPFGVFDMVGNVWEWTASNLEPYPGGTLPPRTLPVSISQLKVIRGCYYRCKINQATTSYRRGWPVNGNDDYSNTGFRCVRDAPKQPT